MAVEKIPITAVNPATKLAGIEIRPKTPAITTPTIITVAVRIMT